jgi:transposase
MPGQRARVFSREFKEAAVRRMLAGEKVQALAAEFRLWPKLLYAWRNSYERGGPEALLPPGRPRKSEPAARGVRGKGEPTDRVAELERKVGQQAVELDFFKRALRHIEASRPPSDGRGATASSPSSTR